MIHDKWWTTIWTSLFFFVDKHMYICITCVDHFTIYIDHNVSIVFICNCYTRYTLSLDYGVQILIWKYPQKTFTTLRPFINPIVIPYCKNETLDQYYSNAIVTFGILLALVSILVMLFYVYLKIPLCSENQTILVFLFWFFLPSRKMFDQK